MYTKSVVFLCICTLDIKNHTVEICFMTAGIYITFENKKVKIILNKFN